MYYRIKLKFLNSPLVRRVYRLTRQLTHRPSRANQHDNYLATLVSEYTPNRSFADIGCMWGISGHFCFLAEESGAHTVTGLDVMHPTDEFIAKRKSKNSRIRFIQGDFNDPAVQSEIGVSNIVLCSGVLYHVPNPLQTLLELRKICDQVLILATASIPEMEVKNAAVFWPYLDSDQRRLWNRLIGSQVGITTPYDPAEGYGNWIWGLTPSAITSMLKIAGFSVERQRVTSFGVVFVCRAEAIKFAPVSGKSESPLMDAFVNARLGEMDRDLWTQGKS
jgi:ubiquinone/menaquinone biosynthesis C-methylase UbiE